MATGIMSAREDEIKLLLDNLEGLRTASFLNKSFYRGTIAGQPVVLTTSGVGKVRAASRAQFLLDRFPIERVIFVGWAGALDPQLEPGDVVVSGRTFQHDFDLSGCFDRERQRSFWYEADPRLIDLALKAGGRLGMGRHIRLGAVLSGDQVINSPQRKQWLWETFGGDCVEMEGAAVAAVCWMNQMPFIVIRGISDLADEKELRTFERWSAEAAARACRVVIEMLGSFSQLDIG